MTDFEPDHLRALSGVLYALALTSGLAAVMFLTMGWGDTYGIMPWIYASSCLLVAIVLGCYRWRLERNRSFDRDEE